MSADRPADPAALPALAGYEMIRQLGRGGMGVVYLARSRSLGRLVAVKTIAHAGDADHLALRFRIEAEAIARLQHPHIVQIFEVGEAGERTFLVLEYLAGDNLKARLQVRPATPTEAARLVEKLARAVHHAHSHGIIHRDLKPSNVLFADDGEPRVADFGLAKIAQAEFDVTSTGQVLGTIHYMAPEQATPNRASAASDVYSLGAILYEMLAGRPPVAGGGPVEALHQLATTDPAAAGRVRARGARGRDAVTPGSAPTLASPKSVTFGSPAGVSRTLLGFRSRWTTPRLWAWAMNRSRSSAST
jgi:serine/threonine protein kinase